IRRTIFSGSSALSRIALMFEFTMSEKREKMPIVCSSSILLSAGFALAAAPVRGWRKARGPKPAVAPIEQLLCQAAVALQALVSTRIFERADRPRTDEAERVG